MDLTPSDQVMIDRLLLEREAAFDSIYHIEQKIIQLAGGAYPFSCPSVLPQSLQPNKARAKSHGKSTTKQRDINKPEASASLSVRKLRGPEEVAYRIHYDCGNGEQTIILTHFNAAAAIFTAPPAGLQIRAIEYLNASGDVVACQ